MSKNHNDELVKRGEVKKAIVCYPFTYREVRKAIDQLPATQTKSPAQIARAIEYLEREADRLKGAGLAVAMLSYWAVADLIRLIIGQKPKGNFWDEEKIFGKEEKP